MQNMFMDNMKSFMDNMNQGSKQSALSEFLSKNVETATAAAQVISKSAEEFMRKNAEIAKDVSNDIASTMQNAHADPQQLMSGTKEVIQKSLSNSQEMVQSASQTGMEVFNLASNRAAENLEECMNHLSSSMPAQKGNAKKK